MHAGAMDVVTELRSLQTLTAGGNCLGLKFVGTDSPKKTIPTTAFPELPACLKQLKLESNFFSSIPRQILSKNLVKLEKLDLSKKNSK